VASDETGDTSTCAPTNQRRYEMTEIPRYRRY
jgi:hypothetical protein